MEKIFVRTSKEDLGLPSITFKIIEFPLSQKQQSILRIIKQSSLLINLDDNSVNKIRSLKKNCMKLLQFASNPKLLKNEDIEQIEPLNTMLAELNISDIPKMQHAVDRAREVSESK